VPAGDIECLVEERLIAFLGDGGELHGALGERVSQAHEIETLISAASSLAARWPRMPSVEKRQRLQSLIARITLNPEGLEIRIRTAHLADILRSGEDIGTCEPMTRSGEPVLVLTIAARLKRTGMEKKFLIGAANEQSGTKADASLLKLIARAHELQEIFTRGGRPISEMAQEAGMSSSYFTRMLRLSFLAPHITRAILRGRQPADLNAHKLMADTRAPIDWHEQRAWLGLSDPHPPRNTAKALRPQKAEGDLVRGAMRVPAGPRSVPLERPNEIFGVSEPTYGTRLSHGTTGPMHKGLKPPERGANSTLPKT